jgi:hypothetical protein
MDIISKGTRRIFQEHLVSASVLRDIRGLFDDAGIEHGELPPGQEAVGERRGLVAEYYASIDWTSAVEVRKVLKVFEEILRREAPTDHRLDGSDAFRKLNEALRRDGYVFEGTRADGRLMPLGGIDLTRVTDASALIDRSTLHDHIRRIEQGIDADPAQAIGSAKELAETVAKHVVRRFGDDPDRYDTFPRLVKAAIGHLNFASEPIAKSATGGPALGMLVGGLGQISEALAQLRNLYGTGHGRDALSGVTGRHARAVVGACTTLCTFLLETLDARQPAPKQGK